MPLPKTEVAKYKKRLMDMRSQITKSLSISTAEVKRPDEATGYSQHQADQGSDDIDRQVNLEVTSEEFRILKQIDRALEKIGDGTYGICDISGEEIPKTRLDVMPEANTTVKAQEKLEKGLL